MERKRHAVGWVNLFERLPVGRTHTIYRCRGKNKVFTDGNIYEEVGDRVTVQLDDFMQSFLLTELEWLDEPYGDKKEKDLPQCGEHKYVDFVFSFLESEPIKEYARARNYELDKENKLLRSRVDVGMRKILFDFMYWDSYVNGVTENRVADHILKNNINRDIDIYFSEIFKSLTGQA